MPEEPFFSGFESEQFPESECTLPNPREPDVLDAPEGVLYLVLSLDVRFRCGARFTLARPYVYRGPEGVLYGWADLEGNTVDHVTRCVHFDHARVVAWRRVPEDYDPADQFPLFRAVKTAYAPTPRKSF